MDKSFHVSDDHLELYALDRLEPAQIDVVEDHLILCDPCRGRLDEVGSFAIAMRESLRRVPAHAEPERFRWEWLAAMFQPRFAMAAAFAALLTVAVGYYTNRPSALPPVASLQFVASLADVKEVQAARELQLVFKDAPVSGSPFRLELVDAAGASIWKGAPAPRPAGLVATIDAALPSGVYFARLYDNANSLVHEYGFRVK